MPLMNNIVSNRKWLKYILFGFRYDIFLLIYTFVVRHYLKNINRDFKNYILDLYNMISEDILKLNESELKNGIWKKSIDIKIIINF